MKRVFNLVYEKYREAVILLALALYLLVGVVNTSIVQFIKVYSIMAKVCVALCAAVFCFYLLFDFIKGKLKITPFFVISSACALCFLWFAHNTTLCFFVALLYVFRNVDFNKILRVAALSLLSSLVIIMFLSITGVIDNPIHSRGEIERLTLGFQSAIIAAQWFFCFCTVYNFYRKEKITLIELLLEGIINYLIYYFSNTRGEFLLICVLITGSLLVKIFNKVKIKESSAFNKFCGFIENKKVNRILKISFTTLPIVIVMFYGILVVLYGTQSAFILRINDLLSGRLKLIYNAFHDRKMTLFGSICDWNDNNGNYIGVDIAFYHYLFNAGVINAVLILCIACLLCFKSFHEKKYWLCFIVLLFLGDSMIESLFYNVHYNVFLLSFIDGLTFRNMLYGKNKANEDESLKQLNCEKDLSYQQFHDINESEDN